MPNWRLMAAWAVLACHASALPLSVGRPFADHMVLPMEKPVPVWGTAEEGAAVIVRFAGMVLESRADAAGRWQVTLPRMNASAKSERLEVTSGKRDLVLKDILVGKVYLCSGQSNMDFPLKKAIGGDEEAAAAGKFPLIRVCNLTGGPTDSRVYNKALLARMNQHDHFTGNWEVASKKNVIEFSAIAWWSGRMIHEKLGVPVGLVENAVGGSGTEGWLPREVLESRPAYKPLLSERWLESDRLAAWLKSRARLNLGPNLTSNHPFRPGFLYESGVRDWSPFPFDAVWWYQGETNAEMRDDAWNHQLLRDLITGWRATLNQPALPFYGIQLPKIGGSDPLRRYWPQYREVQAKVAKELPYVHLIVTQDLGWDSPDVHPPDKLPVAQRLAAAVLKAK